MDNKFKDWDETEWKQKNFRAVPNTVVRASAFIGENVVLAYEGYLLDQVDHVQLSRAMQKLRANLPMKTKKPRFFEKDSESK